MLVTKKTQKDTMMAALTAASLTPLTAVEEASLDLYLNEQGDKEVPSEQVVDYLEGIEYAAVQYCIGLRKPAVGRDYSIW